LALFKRKKQPLNQPSWRAYQESLRRQHFPSKRSRLQRGGPKTIVVLLILVLAGGWWVLSAGINENADEPNAVAVVSAPAEDPITTENPAPAEDPALLSKSDVHIMLGNTRLINLKSNPLTVEFDGRTYQVHTSLEFGLQNYLLKRMDRVNSRYIGIVAMAPDTGRVLTLAGFNKVDPQQDPCLTADYPAASIFKIVSAAAAVQEKGYTAGTRLKFNGYKHTLYKRQLTDKTNRYTNSISFKDSFAKSVNPVFGKIGALYLDRQALEIYGNAFAFNRTVDFELPWPTSRLSIKDDTYHRAEIASGFNRQTTLSPLHGAVIVSAVVNGGLPVEPSLVDRIVDQGGNAVYRTEPRFLDAAVSDQTAAVLDQLMAATVVSGTARKIFRGHRRSKVLSRLHLGGKTGSIFNRAHDARFDWFVGFASEKRGTEKIVVSVVVAHEEYIGIRAGQYARMAIEHHFKDYFSKQKQTGGDSQS
jgi:cell division protein FtsI/penicillin-binding protein 2